MITVLAVTVTVLLAAGAGLTLIRVVRGPSVLDRIVATDVLLAIVVVAIATEAAFTRDATALPVLVVLSILGFVGSVSVARFARSSPRPAAPDPAAGPASSEPAAGSASLSSPSGAASLSSSSGAAPGVAR